MLDSLDLAHRRALARLDPDRAERVMTAVMDEHAEEIAALRRRIVQSLDRHLDAEADRRAAG